MKPVKSHNKSTNITGCPKRSTKWKLTITEKKKTFCSYNIEHVGISTSIDLKEIPKLTVHRSFLKFASQ